MGCDCGKPKCNGHCGVSPAVLQINNPSECVLFHRVEVPASMGDSKTNPPKSGAYKNVLLFYEADQTSWLYSSDGIPQKLVNGLTDYSDAINLPQINGVTLLGNKNSADLKVADAPMVITIASGNTAWSGADTAEDIYNFFLNQGKVNVVFEGSENYGYEIVSAAYIPGEQKMMCMTTVASVDTGSSPVEFSGNALYGLMTFYTVDKAVDVGELDLQPKLSITDFTGLNMTDGYVLEGVPATDSSIGMVKPGDGLEVDSDGVLSISDIERIAYTFDTVADMKAATNLINGSFAQTLGFRSVNDGGGAIYLITDTGTANEMDTIAVDSLYANVILPIAITPAMLGAYGDNTHNDTSALQRCIALSHDINLDNKTYVLNDTLTINKSNFKIHDGEISYTKNSDIVIELQGSVSNVDIYNIKFEGTADADTNIKCIANNSSISNNFRNISICNNDISEFNLGISVNADLGGDFTNIKIENNKIYNIYGTPAGVGYGIHVANQKATFLNVCIRNNDVSACGRHCLYIARGRGFIVENNYIHDNADPVASFKPAIVIGRSMDVVFRNNKIYRCNNIALYLISELNPEPSYELDSYPCKNVIIENNEIRESQNNAGLMIGFGDVTTNLCENIIVRNNTFNNSLVAIYGVKNYVMDSNILEKDTGGIVTINGGENQTSSVFMDNLSIKNNTFISGESATRLIRLQLNFYTQPSNVTFENNKSNNGHMFYCSSPITSQAVQLINQDYSSELVFGSGGAFKPYTINGQTVPSV